MDSLVSPAQVASQPETHLTVRKKRVWSGDFFLTHRGSFKAVDKVGQFEVDASLPSVSFTFTVAAASVTLASSSVYSSVTDKTLLLQIDSQMNQKLTNLH